MTNMIWLALITLLLVGCGKDDTLDLTVQPGSSAIIEYEITPDGHLRYRVICVNAPCSTLTFEEKEVI